MSDSCKHGLSEARLTELVTLRRHCVLYRDESDDVTDYRKWQGKIDKIDAEFKANGVLP
ncbi:hypothetical protein V7O62_12330 [Methanolobus sp. ZRKC2]|uniref:hypothetical protein n=1 Tax=Methanolobus sp. ZRKC2 TaxID=3125783 RepID=UPI0032520107